MNELFNNYFKEIYSQSKSQRLDMKTLDLNARKYAWNYQRFFSEISSDAKILDVGCGVGHFLYYLKKNGFQNVAGIDVSPVQVEHALQMQPDIDFQHITNPIEFLQQQPDEYDVIVLNDVLEHIERDQIISNLNAIYHSLKPGGIVIIKTINAAYPLGFAHRYNDFTHTVAFHEKSLTQLLRHTNFSEIRCYQEEIGLYNPLFVLKKSMVIVVRFLLKIMIYLSECDWQRIISVNLIAVGRKK
ncbi:MAG: class I SAM-dependent methyltransferase [Candidatus Electrothrix communis]|nr:MAG: class I SAM-dependent methyltransferase [Candidatus Electrothrix communis]